MVGGGGVVFTLIKQKSIETTPWGGAGIFFVGLPCRPTRISQWNLFYFSAEHHLLKDPPKKKESTLTPFLSQQSLQQKLYEETEAWVRFSKVPVTCFLLMKFSIILKMIQWNYQLGKQNWLVCEREPELRFSRFCFEMKLPVIQEAELIGLWARNCATIQQILLLKFAFGP